MVSNNARAPDSHDDDVPLELRAVFAEIKALTDTFCERHLNEEYKLLCREMARALCVQGSPAMKGKPATWASAVVYCVGWVNFLTDPSQSPHMRADDIARGFGVAPSTMHRSAKTLREALGLMPYDPDWCLPSRLLNNPLVWLIEVDGVPIDVRTAPLEVQDEAFRLGLIPFVPSQPQAGDPSLN